MLRFLSFFLLAFSSTLSIAGRGDIDKYNQETIDLLDDLDSCLIRVDYAIKESESIGYEYGQAYALYLKGYIHRVRNDLGKAFLANLKGLSVLQNVHDERAPETLVRLYLNTGEILKKHFNYSDAIQYYSEGLEIAKREHLKNWVIDLTYSIGNTYKWSGDLNLAADYLHKAYQIAQEEGDEHTIVNSLNQMGLIFRNSHNYDTAILFFEKMLTYPYKDLSADKYKGRAYHNLANTYAHAGDTAKAIAQFYEALRFKLKSNKSTETFITENDLAELYFLNGEVDLAKERIQKCVEHYQEMRLDPQHYKIFDLARKINSMSGDYTKSDHYADRYFVENDKFIKQQEELIMIRDQFKMELLTASFFSELERNKNISNLKTALLLMSILSVIIIGYMKYRQIWVRNIVSRRLDELLSDDFE